MFPGVVIPDHDYGKLQAAIEDCIIAKGLQNIPSMVKKTIQLYETMIVRHGVMSVGPTGKDLKFEVIFDRLPPFENFEKPPRRLQGLPVD